MASYVAEILPPILEPTSEPPPFFDGTVRLYVSYDCPFSQRVVIIRNVKGLQDKIKLVAIHLQNKPSWYKEKLYPENKVPALEHNGKVIGESLDLIKYVDTSFEGPSLLPTDPNKLKFAEEMTSYGDTFLKKVFTAFRGNRPSEEASSEFDYLEKSLEKFDDGSFFLGQFSQVDAAYAPFIERFHIYLREAWNYDITSGRPKLAAYIQEINKIGAYKHTKCDPEALVKLYKSRFMASS